MTQRRKLIVVAAVVVPMFAYAGWAGCVRFCGPAVQNDTFIGRTEPGLRRSFGGPDKDLEGYQSLALSVPPSLPPGRIRTLIFHPRGLLHPEGGTLWLWVVDRDGVWLCFESCWFADGVAF